MNEFVSRLDMVTVERSGAARAAAAVAPVQAVKASPETFAQGGANPDLGEQARREHMAGMSDYARVQQRVADILAGLDAGGGDAAAAHERANAALQVEPTVIIPLSASIEVIERAVDVARAIAENAAMARSAQANLAPGALDQILAAAA